MYMQHLAKSLCLLLTYESGRLRFFVVSNLCHKESADQGPAHQALPKTKDFFCAWGNFLHL